MNASIRGLGVAIAICSWIATSNHCAFAAIATAADSAQSSCPFHSKPTKQKEQSAQVQCCKTLRAVIPLATKSWARNDAKFSDSDRYYDERALVIKYSQTMLAPLFLDTGPPAARSFAELILQRSLFAHAPPVGA